MTAVMFELRDFQYAVKFPFNRDLVDILKMRVPSYARTWNSISKEWMVDAGYARTLADTIRRAGHTVVGLEPPKPPPPPPRDSASSTNWARNLFQRVGPSRVEPVHRALTRILHPDNTATGDTQLQRELNDARADMVEGRP